MRKKKCQANRKYVFILIILVLAISGILCWQSKFWSKKETKIQKVERPEKIEIKKELVDKIVEKIIPENFDRKTACFFIDDFNSNGVSEILIATTPPQPTFNAYLAIVVPTDNIGNYKKLADFSFKESISFRSTPCLQDKKDILDIDGDGKKEFILDLGTGGASSEAFGIFKIDWEKSKIEWLKIKRKDGQIENSFFLRGGSVMHQEDFELKDLDSDGKLEIIEKEGEYIGGDWESKESWKWQISVYKWDGQIFNYDEKLSSSIE